ncbi:MAG: hypothetical protein SGJ09_02225 [Phycisphaerae bacterium]|nr:hypothetical protein [Phycisphaerae bacterium]
MVTPGMPQQSASPAPPAPGTVDPAGSVYQGIESDLFDPTERHVTF